METAFIAAQSMAAIVAALFAIYTFRANNLIKAAEMLIKLEEEYRNHLKTLLEIEYTSDYEKIVKPALLANAAGRPFTDDESKTINRLEGLLRHFLGCRYIRDLKISGDLIDRAYDWYLNVLIDPKRPELTAYIEKYWPAVLHWARERSRAKEPTGFTAVRRNIRSFVTGL